MHCSKSNTTSDPVSYLNEYSNLTAGKLYKNWPPPEIKNNMKNVCNEFNEILAFVFLSRQTVRPLEHLPH